jgi:CheY-like chemotaxis protein
MRVLIAEDCKDAADTEALLLGMYGHTVVVARDGEEALKKFKEFRPEAVILDIGLPRVDGWEVARRIREENTSGRKVLLIAMTGYGLDEDRQRSTEAGFDLHLLKPVDPPALLDALRGVPAKEPQLPTTEDQCNA